MDSAAVCDNCGKYVQEGQKFCPHCGTKQEKPEKEAVELETSAETVETVVVDADGTEVSE